MSRRSWAAVHSQLDYRIAAAHPSRDLSDATADVGVSKEWLRRLGPAWLSMKSATAGFLFVRLAASTAAARHRRHRFPVPTSAKAVTTVGAAAPDVAGFAHCSIFDNHHLDSPKFGYSTVADQLR